MMRNKDLKVSLSPGLNIYIKNPKEPRPKLLQRIGK